MLHISKEAELDWEEFIPLIERKISSIERVLPKKISQSIDVKIESEAAHESVETYVCQTVVPFPNLEPIVVTKKDEDPNVAVKKCFEATRKTVRRRLRKIKSSKA